MRLIDADDLEKRLFTFFLEKGYKPSVEDIRNFLHYSPTIDNRQSGKWEKDKFERHNKNASVCIYGVSCNICQTFQHVMTKYCPECGARMEGVPENLAYHSTVYKWKEDKL